MQQCLIRLFLRRLLNGSTQTDVARIGGTDGGLGVFAAKNANKGDLLCVIPKAAVLSVKTSGIADMLEENKIRGGLGLIIAILYQMSLHSASPWHVYLSELPSREYLPMFWTQDELDLLQGTGVAHNALEDLQHTQEDFEMHVIPLVKQHPRILKADVFTLDNFRRAASWVASRAFGVDSHHGMSLVPLADIFNHKAAVVQLSDEYAIEPICFEGGDDFDSEDDTDEDEEAGACGDDDCAQPGCTDHHGGAGEAAACEDDKCRDSGCTDHQHHGTPTSRGSLLQGLDSAAAEKHRLEIGICGAVRDDGEGLLQIVAASDVPKGAEIHNTYGELGNADLVSKYGFALSDNPFSAVILDKASLLQAAEGMLGVREMRLRSRFLRKESELLDEESEPFEVLPGGCIGPSLAVTLYIMCADDQLYNSWSHMDDAVQSLQQVQKSSSAYDPAVTSTTALGSRENTSSHGSTKRKRDSLADLTHEQHSQQVGGQHSTIKRPCSQACDGSHVQKDQDRKADDGLQHEDGEHKNRDEEEWQPSIIPLRSVAKALINGRAAACLSTAVGEHLQMYKHASLTEDLEQLQKAQIQCKRLRYRDEHWKAVVSALRLVVQEKEILQEALKALQDS